MTAMPASNSFLAEPGGSAHISVQGTRPLLRNVRRNQEIYNREIPKSPTTPRVNEGESHGPPNEILNRIVLESSSRPAIAGALQSGGLASVMVVPRG
mgnify:CR=1 FL=1